MNFPEARRAMLIAVAGLAVAIAVPPVANAAPTPKPSVAANGGITLVRQGGGYRSSGVGAPRIMSTHRAIKAPVVRIAPRVHSGGGKHVYHAPKHRHVPRGVYLYSAPAYYAYSYYDRDDDDCRWLYRKAKATGLAKWWRRYEECIDGDDD